MANAPTSAASPARWIWRPENLFAANRPRQGVITPSASRPRETRACSSCQSGMAGLAEAAGKQARDLACFPVWSYVTPPRSSWPRGSQVTCPGHLNRVRRRRGYPGRESTVARYLSSVRRDTSGGATPRAPRARRRTVWTRGVGVGRRGQCVKLTDKRRDLAVDEFRLISSAT